jgi:hypothetical protein
MSECKHKYVFYEYSTPLSRPSIYCEKCEGDDLTNEQIVEKLNAYELIKADSPFDMINMKERAEKAEARVKELEATVTNVIRWLNGGCSVEPAIEELNLVMEQSNDE